MTRKPRIEPIGSAHFEVVLDQDFTPTNVPYWPRGWFVRNRETCASTDLSPDWEDYYKLKRVWRRSKTDFDSACRFMKFIDLFSTGGVEL